MVKFLRESFRATVARVSNRWRFGERAPSEIVYRYDTTRDGYQKYKTDALSFVGMSNLLKSGETGRGEDLILLQQELEARDDYLQAVANTRRLGVIQMDWEIRPATAADRDTSRVDKVLAEEAAAYCEEVLRDNESFALILEHLQDATGPNLAAAEIIWDGFTPAGFEAIPGDRISIDYSKDKDIRIITADSPRGVVMRPGKFIVHIPHWNAGFPFRRTITRAAAMLTLAKKGSWKDWIVFCEVYGMPVRWASAPKGMSSADKQELLTALADIGSDAYGVFREGVEIQFREVGSRESQPYDKFIERCEKNQAILFLGQNLSTEISGDTGSRAAAEVHNNVRRDLTEFDMRVEARTIRGQLFAPMLTYRYPNCDVPLPIFARRFREVEDRAVEGNVLDIAVNRLKLPVEASVAYERLGLPEPPRNIEGEIVGDLVQGVPDAPEFGGGGFGAG